MVNCRNHKSKPLPRKMLCVSTTLTAASEDVENLVQQQINKVFSLNSMGTKVFPIVYVPLRVSVSMDGIILIIVKSNFNEIIVRLQKHHQQFLENYQTHSRSGGPCRKKITSFLYSFFGFYGF